MKPRSALILAVAIAFVVPRWVPFGYYLMYPFTLLATWVHESGHGLGAIATGGHFDRLMIFWDASGWAEVRHGDGWPDAISCLGGLWAPPLLGAFLLAFARGPRRARLALVGLCIGLLVTLALVVRSPAGVFAVLFAVALLGWATLWSPANRQVFVQFIAITLALDSLGRLLPYAVSSTAMSGGHESKSDVALIADAVGGHYMIWGVIVIVVALALLAVGAWAGFRRSAGE
jgi:Peptidase M50B-like